MPSQPRGFAHALCQTREFEGIEQSTIDEVLAEAADQTEVTFAAANVDLPFVRSGAPFTHMVFVAQGTLVHWQHPYSPLRSPFLIGGHEFLMSADRWMATYSAIPGSVTFDFPISLLRKMIDVAPALEENIARIVLRRLSRFYWTSLSTTGPPYARVAAALVSRLALDDDDHGAHREVSVPQTELMRLTVLSRTAVADGIAQLVDKDIIRLGDASSGTRYPGVVLIPAVDLLKEAAFSDVRQLIRSRFDDSERAAE